MLAQETSLLFCTVDPFFFFDIDFDLPVRVLCFPFGRKKFVFT